MTNSQAKSELMQIYMSLSEKKKKALDMAFKAMEQAGGEYITRSAGDEIRQKNYDLISRQEALKELTVSAEYHANDSREEALLRRDRDIIRALPSVNPQEPKTVLYSGDGYADGYMVYDMAECPSCGYEYEDGDKDWGLSFCPNCGQKLDWESEE